MDNLLYVTGYVFFVVMLLFVLNIFLKVVRINSSKRRVLAALFALLISFGMQSVLFHFPLLNARVHDVVVAVTWLAAALLMTSCLRFFVWEGVLGGEEGYSVVPKILRYFISTVFWLLFASLYLKWVLGQSVIQLFAATGVVAIVLGYAAQGVLGDIFSGMALAISRNVKRGDGVELGDGLSGKVIELGWRSAKVLSWANTVEIVPHSALSKMVIRNLSSQEAHVLGTVPVVLFASIPPANVLSALGHAAQDASFPIDVLRSKRSASSRKWICGRGGARTEYLGLITLPSGETAYGSKKTLTLSLLWHKLRKMGYDIATGAYSDEIAQQQQLQWSPAALKSVLMNINIFDGLGADDYDDLISASVVERFIDQERVIVQHDEDDTDLYVLLSGHCAAYETNSAGDMAKTRDLYGGASAAQHDVFGIQAALLGEPRRITVRSVGVSDVLHITRDSLVALTKKHPNVVDQLASVLASRIAENQATLARLSEASEQGKASLTDILAERIKTLFSLS